MTTPTARANANTPHTHPVITTTFGSLIQTFATGFANRALALRVNISTRGAASAPASVPLARVDLYGIHSSVSVNVLTTANHAQHCSSGIRQRALAFPVRNQSQGAPSLSSGIQILVAVSVHP